MPRSVNKDTTTLGTVFYLETRPSLTKIIP